MIVGIWIYHALTFLPIFGLIFFNNEIAEVVHSQFELGATLLGDVANYSGFVAALLLWFLINDRLDFRSPHHSFKAGVSGDNSNNKSALPILNEEPP